MARISHLPVETLHLIFEATKQRLSTSSDQYAWVMQNRLARFARVCKHWHPIAERLLYQSVAIGLDLNHFQIYTRDHEPPPPTSPEYIAWFVQAMKKNSSQDDPICPASSIASDFLETIQLNQRLASLVTELKLRIPDEEVLGEQSHQFIKILAACPNVRRLKIIYHLPHPNMSATLMESLMLKETLVSFELQSETDDILWETPTLLRMMRKWREIEHVKAFSYSLSGYDEDGNSGSGVEDEDVELGCCPKLQSIDLDWGWYRPAFLRCRDLQTLLRMCPTGMKTFKAALAMDDGTLDVLEDCIRAWAPTLETLVLRRSWRHGPPTSITHLSDCVANLTQLKILVLESLILDPCVLSTLPRLTHLYVARASTEDRRGLLAAMDNFTMFTALRTLYIGNTGSTTNGPEVDRLHEQLDAIIKVRGLVELHEDADDGLEDLVLPEQRDDFFSHIRSLGVADNFKLHTCSSVMKEASLLSLSHRF